MQGNEAIVKALIEQKVDRVFGFPGGAVIPLYDAFLDYSKQVRHILVRHEQGAAHAAEGYARASGKAGVCIATSGPGATNLITGIADAYMDSVPIVALAGQVPTSLIGNDAFQEADMMGITRPITKHNFQLRNPNEIRSTIGKAFKIATTGRPGPVYIDLPKDVQMREVKKDYLDLNTPGFNPRIRGHPRQISEAAKMIANAERPLLLAGGGATSAGCSAELEKLAVLFNIPVTTTMTGKGVFPENHPLSLGMLGMHGRKSANYAVVNADLIVAIGVRFTDRITGNLKTFAEHAKVIHIDIDTAEIGKNVAIDLPIVGDAKNILNELLPALKKHALKKDSEWSKMMKKFAKECCCDMDTKKNPILPEKILFEIQKVLGRNDIVVTGVGQHQMFASHFLKMKSPRTFISSGGLGTMGFGLPAAIGAKVAKPNSNVFCIEGDGGFAMTQQELATSKEEQIPIVTTIFNNAYLGMVRQWLELFMGKRYSSVLLKRTPDFAKVAEAYGLTGETITKHNEIAPALKAAMKRKETTIMDIHIAEESNILPMFAAGASVSEFFGSCMKGEGKFF